MFAWALLASLVLLAVLVAPGLLGCVYVRDDLGAFHLPLRGFYAEQLARGEPFDWMPQLFCGFYLTGEGQAGTYHPLHLILYRFLPLQAAWACELVASYPFMLAGMYFFLRRLLGRRDAAMFGSVVFTFSGFNVLHFVHPNAIAVVAHVPWLLWTIDLGLTDTDRRRTLAAQTGFTLLTGSQLLLGYPQYVWFSLLVEAAYALFVLTGERYAAKRHAERVGLAERAKGLFGSIRPLRPWQRLAIAKLAGVMLGGMQLLPTAESLGHSVRRSVDAAFLTAGSLHPLNLVQLVAPYLFTHRVAGQNTHEMGAYVGAVPLMLLVWLGIRRRELGGLRRLVVCVAGFGLFVLLLALGKYAPIYRLQHFLPLVGSFRCPCRYLVLVSLCVAVLSAVAVAVLARRQESGERIPRPRTKPLWTVVATSALAATIALALRSHPHIAATPAILAGPLLIGSAALLLVFAAGGARWALIGLVLFAAADLGYYGMSYAVFPYVEPFEAYLARAKAPQAACDGRAWAGTIPFEQTGLHAGSRMTLLGWHRADGYIGLEPDRNLDYRQLPALRAAGVRWVRRSQATEAIAGLLPHDDQWLEVPHPLKRVRLVTRAVASDDPARDVGRIPLHCAALVEEPLGLPPGLPGTAAVAGERPGRIRVRVECPSKQLLVVSDSFHLGWQAEVDRQPQPVLRANGDFLGCVVGPGKHQVVLEFRPRSLRNGLIVSCLGLAMIVGLAVVHPWIAASPTARSRTREGPVPSRPSPEAVSLPEPEEELCPTA